MKTTIPFKLKLPKEKKVRRKLSDRDPMKQSLGIHSSLSAIAAARTKSKQMRIAKKMRGSGFALFVSSVPLSKKNDLKTRILQTVTGSPEHNAHYDLVDIVDLCFNEMTVEQLQQVLANRNERHR